MSVISYPQPNPLVRDIKRVLHPRIRLTEEDDIHFRLGKLEGQTVYLIALELERTIFSCLGVGDWSFACAITPMEVLITLISLSLKLNFF